MKSKKIIILSDNVFCDKHTNDFFVFPDILDYEVTEPKNPPVYTQEDMLSTDELMSCKILYKNALYDIISVPTRIYDNKFSGGIIITKKSKE